MQKYKKTYAIYHLTEKHTVFYLGKTRVHVSFTGGIVTKRGVTPATFTTDDPIVQLAIEQSADFKRGAISIRSKYPMHGEVKIGRNELAPKIAERVITEKIPAQTPAAMPVEEAICATEEIAAAATAEAELRADTEQEEGSADVVTEASDAPTQAEGDEESGLEVIEVSCKDVAKQYLQEHYGEKPTPLRTIADVQECAAKYGIKFCFV